MNNFELFKLKQAGLTNLNILAVLEYQKQEKKSLSWHLAHSFLARYGSCVQM